MTLKIPDIHSGHWLHLKPFQLSSHLRQFISLVFSGGFPPTLFILDMIQILPLTIWKHEPDEVVLKTFPWSLQCGQEHCFIGNNIWSFLFRKQLFSCKKQAFLQFLPSVFQTINLLFTVKQLTSTSSWKSSLHNGISSFMFKKDRDDFTKIFIWSITTKLKSWFITLHFTLNQTLHILLRIFFCFFFCSSETTMAFQTDLQNTKWASVYCFSQKTCF